MRLILACILALVGGLAWPGANSAQTDSISGIVNKHTAVLGIDSCNRTLAVKSGRGFKADDWVLIIQMKGATVTTTDDASFGQIVSYRDAGNYELARVRYTYNESITLNDDLINHYDLTGLVQLVRVASYTNAVVKDTVTAPPWNGTSGGVVVLKVAGKLVLHADIDVSGRGFRGGNPSLQYEADGATGYKYFFLPGLSGEKGEGIAAKLEAYRYGRGRLANGAGGGNAMMAGGGGGGNHAAGGKGGFQYEDSLDVGGLGGEPLVYSNDSDKVFLGGGGGGGQFQWGSDAGTYGACGGGIIIIIADTIAGNSRYLKADGARVLDTVYSNGGGGGGGGGVILLDVAGYSSVVTASVRGGDGANSFHDSGEPSTSPGGGGGGGIVWVSNGSMPGNLTVTATGGAAGWQCNSVPTAYPCPDHHGAQDGDNGGGMVDLEIPGAP